MKATAEEFAFHQQLLGRDDPTTPARCADRLYPTVVHHTLARAWRTYGTQAVDPALVEEAVGKALLDYFERPQRYDPNLASLESYLSMAAFGDFKNESAKERRRMRHQVSLADAKFREQDVADEQQNPEQMVERAMTAHQVGLEIACSFPNPMDRQIIALLRDGVRATAAYAHVLGLGHLPPDAQAREVKRVKDRLTKRFHRMRGKLS